MRVFKQYTIKDTKPKLYQFVKSREIVLSGRAATRDGSILRQLFLSLALFRMFNNIRKKHRKFECIMDGGTDRRTDRPTNIVTYRVAYHATKKMHAQVIGRELEARAKQVE